jgi:hypothetical protein
VVQVVLVAQETRHPQAQAKVAMAALQQQQTHMVEAVEAEHLPLAQLD